MVLSPWDQRFESLECHGFLLGSLTKEMDGSTEESRGMTARDILSKHFARTPNVCLPYFSVSGFTALMKHCARTQLNKSMRYATSQMYLPCDKPFYETLLRFGRKNKGKEFHGGIWGLLFENYFQISGNR